MFIHLMASYLPSTQSSSGNISGFPKLPRINRPGGSATRDVTKAYVHDKKLRKNCERNKKSSDVIDFADF